MVPSLFLFLKANNVMGILNAGVILLSKNALIDKELMLHLYHVAHLSMHREKAQCKLFFSLLTLVGCCAHLAVPAVSLTGLINLNPV